MSPPTNRKTSQQAQEPQASPALIRIMEQELEAARETKEAVQELLVDQKLMNQRLNTLEKVLLDRFSSLEESIKSRDQKQDAKNEDMEKRVRDLEDWRTETKGGWKVIVLASSAVGAVMHWIGSHVSGWFAK